MIRKIARGVAHVRMKKKGMVHVNKKNGKNKESFFSNHWREYV